MIDASLIADAQRKWDASRDTPAFASLAQSTVDTCCDAVQLVATRLATIGYPVANMIGTPFADLDDRIHRLRTGKGVNPPLILARFWSSVGHIQFTDHQNCVHDTFWANVGLDNVPSDGFHICPCDDMYIDAMIWDAGDSTDSTGNDFQYCFSPDIYEKDNCSGGGGYLLAYDSGWYPSVIGPIIPQSCVVALTTRYPIDLLSYARFAILECGGFPGFVGRRNFEDLRETLTADLPVF